MRLSGLLAHFQLETAAPLTDDFEVRGVRPLAEAGEGELSFLSNPKYRADVANTKASAILVKNPVPEAPCIQIICPDPYVTLARVLALLYPEPAPEPGIHTSAVLGENVKIGEQCHVGPYCVIGDDTVLGDGCVLEGHVTVGPGCSIGEGTRLFANVVVYRGCILGKQVRVHANSVIGSDGFGYANERGVHVKVPQIGRVCLEDHVEIGSNVSIDRGALSDTVIGEGTKIDNMVQIGHGVRIGKHSIIVSQTGISGSATVGNHAILAGQVGVIGHVKIGDGAVVMGDSVVTKNLEAPGKYAGNPAVPHMRHQRRQAALNRLPELLDRVKKLEKANQHEQQ